MRYEPSLQLILGLEPQRAHARLRGRRVPPLALRGFVPADVHELEGEQRKHLVEDALVEAQRCLGRAERVRVYAPARTDLEAVRELGVAERVVSRDRRRAVAGQLDLGHHVDVQVGGEGHDRADLFLGVEPTVGHAVVHGAVAAHGRRLAPRADFRQPRITLDLDTPTLVLGQVPVEDVEFGRRHALEQALDLLHVVEVAPHVQHHPAPTKARLVGELEGRERAAVEGHRALVGGDLERDRQHLAQALESVEEPRRRAAREPQRAVATRDSIGLGFELGRHRERDPSRRARARAKRHVPARRALEPGREPLGLACDGRARVCSQGHEGTGLQPETLEGLGQPPERGRPRHDVEARLGEPGQPVDREAIRLARRRSGTSRRGGQGDEERREGEEAHGPEVSASHSWSRARTVGPPTVPAAKGRSRRARNLARRLGVDTDFGT